jgi:thiamine biosynthesis lipoprotein
MRVAMGTLVAIEALHESTAAATAAVQSAFAAVAEVERLMYPRGAESDLSRINHAPLNTPTSVHASTCSLLNFAIRLSALTEGVFDPCLPIRAGRITDIEIIQRVAQAPTDSATWQVVCHAPVALDFGGFAKGYAVDRAIGELVSRGCAGGLVNAGGDLRVFGPRSEPLLLRGPEGRLHMLKVPDAMLREPDVAVAVSDADCRQHPPEHQGYYRRRACGETESRDSSEDASGLTARYVAVIAKEAVIADALAKCVLLCPEAVAERVLNVFGATRLNEVATTRV